MSGNVWYFKHMKYPGFIISDFSGVLGFGHMGIANYPTKTQKTSRILKYPKGLIICDYVNYICKNYLRI